MARIQHLEEGKTVMVEGYEMIVTNLRIVEDVYSPQLPGKPIARFQGVFTDRPSNDELRNTSFNGGTYGGNHLVYTW